MAIFISCVSYVSEKTKQRDGENNNYKGYPIIAHNISFWLEGVELNHRRDAYETSALPPELPSNVYLLEPVVIFICHSWGARIRTSIAKTKTSRPAVRRLPNTDFYFFDLRLPANVCVCE